jgi:hypothetical protein
MFTPLNFVNDKSELNNKERAIQLGRSLFRRGPPAGKLPCSLMRRHSAAPSAAVGVSLRLNKKKLAESQPSQHRCQLAEKIGSPLNHGHIDFLKR